MFSVYGIWVLQVAVPHGKSYSSDRGEREENLVPCKTNSFKRVVTIYKVIFYAFIHVAF